MRRRRELQDERRLLEHQAGEVAAQREKLETDRNLAEMEGRKLEDEIEQNTRRRAQIETEIADVRDLARTLTLERERLARVKSMHKDEHERAQRAVDEEMDRRAQRARANAFNM